MNLPNGSSLRPVEPRDRALLEAWIASDPFHAGRVDVEFFMQSAEGEDAWALEDSQGKVIFYFKTQTAVRMHIQFGPAQSAGDRRRNGEALTEGLTWLESVLTQNKFREILFSTDNPVLERFAKKRLGFRAMLGDMVKGLCARSRINSPAPGSEV